MATEKKIAKLSGLNIQVHIPTEERLNLQIPGLTPDVFRKAAADLEDYFLEVDDKYKKHRTQGRNWKAHGRKRRQASEKKERIRTLTFSPFPSRFANVLRTVRRDIYKELHDKCLVIATNQHGSYRQNLYLLPYAKVPAFQKQINKQNKKIIGLNTQIERFTETKYWKRVLEILASYHVIVEKIVIPKFEEVTLDVTPLALESGAVKQLVENEYKKMYAKLDKTSREKFARLDEEEQAGLERINQELERKYNETVVKGIEDVESKLKAIIQRIAVAKKLYPKTVKNDLTELRELAISAGLEAVADAVIDPVTMAFENPDKALDLFGTKNFGEISTKVSGRVRGLIDNL
ncbi:Uncharacterised protein [uncultured archaeon]|nr:Uncharacterised protein [uncultured archaeon]